MATRARTNPCLSPIAIGLLGLIALVGLTTEAFAVVERLTATYQPLYNPQAPVENRPEIHRVRFVTERPSPEAEFAAIATPNKLAEGVSSRDVNLASLHRIQIKGEPLNGGKSARVVIDMSQPSRLEAISGASYTRLQKSVMRCVERVGVKQGYHSLSVRIITGESESNRKLDLGNLQKPLEGVPTR